MIIEKHKDIIASMIGRTIEEIHFGYERLVFIMKDDKKGPTKYIFIGESECCSECYISDICGELTDLLYSPLLIAEVSTSEVKAIEVENNKQSKYRFQDCSTWTFYKFATIKGHVTIRWLGTSPNGYYSEEVTVEAIYHKRPMKGEINDANGRDK